MALSVRIITPDSQIERDGVEMVVAPGKMGELGILPKHTQMLSTLKEGRVRLKKEGKEEGFKISPGFLEVMKDKVTFLVKEAESL
ncbi:ATP synthase F1 subunit epsilon [bacterium]|nr:ATP synthase F1 subunit epsilon [bacterium]